MASNPFKPKCGICGGRRKIFRSPRIHILALDGVKKIKVCETCFDATNSIYQMKNGIDPDPINKE